MDGFFPIRIDAQKGESRTDAAQQQYADESSQQTAAPTRDGRSTNYNRADVTTLIGGNGDDFFHNNDDSTATIDAGAGYDTYDFHSVGNFNFTMPTSLANQYSTEVFVLPISMSSLFTYSVS